jgi:hypothetical protein
MAAELVGAGLALLVIAVHIRESAEGPQQGQSSARRRFKPIGSPLLTITREARCSGPIRNLITIAAPALLYRQPSWGRGPHGACTRRTELRLSLSASFGEGYFARNGMTVMAPTAVVPKAVPVGALSTPLRLSSTILEMSALRFCSQGSRTVEQRRHVNDKGRYHSRHRPGSAIPDKTQETTRSFIAPSSAKSRPC